MPVGEGYLRELPDGQGDAGLMHQRCRAGGKLGLDGAEAQLVGHVVAVMRGAGLPGRGRCRSGAARTGPVAGGRLRLAAVAGAGECCIPLFLLADLMAGATGNVHQPFAGTQVRQRPPDDCRKHGQQKEYCEEGTGLSHGVWRPDEVIVRFAACMSSFHCRKGKDLCLNDGLFCFAERMGVPGAYL